MADNIIQNAAMTEEKEKRAEASRILQWLKELWEKICGKNNIIQQKFEQRLAEFEDNLSEAVERNEVTKETLDEVLSLVKDLDGKIDSISPENVDEVMGKFMDDADKIIRDIDAEYVQVKGRLTDKMREALMFKAQRDPKLYKESFGIKAAGISDTKELLSFLSSKEFEEDFLKNANIIQCTELKAENQLLLEYKGQVFLATAEFEKDDKKTVLTVHLSDSPYTADDIMAKPDVFSKTEKTKRYNAEHSMMRTFCNKNGYNYLPNKVPLERLSPQQNFIRKHVVKAVSADNIENVVDDMGNYRIRNADTGEMLVASSEDGKIAITYYPDTETIADTDGKHRLLGSWQASDDNHIHSEFVLSSVGIEVNDLLHSDEMREYLEISGITKEMQEIAFTHESDTEWSLVTSKEGNGKVDALYKQCKEMTNFVEELDKAKGLSTSYTVKKIQSRNSTFVNISDGTNTMAFSFDENGNPTTINFKDGEKGRFKCVYNIQTNAVNDNFITYQTMDRTAESFKRLHTIMEATLEEMKVERGTFKETREPDTKKSVDKERKFWNDERNRA